MDESNSCNFIKLVMVVSPQISVSKVVVLENLFGYQSYV